MLHILVTAADDVDASCVVYIEKVFVGILTVFLLSKRFAFSITPIYLLQWQ